MKIAVDGLAGSDAADFFDEHVRQMRSITPPEGGHALDAEYRQAGSTACMRRWKADMQGRQWWSV
ncbi:hypothetical protein GCM10010331_20530 [Streptomyces xanthochromogenes]|nr:hypothetical protein GCM10010331_20530 [Streptomyces xanthochromogenes]